MVVLCYGRRKPRRNARRSYAARGRLIARLVFRKRDVDDGFESRGESASLRKASGVVRHYGAASEYFDFRASAFAVVDAQGLRGSLQCVRAYDFRGVRNGFDDF